MSVSQRVIKNSAYLYAKTAITALVVLYSTRLVLQSLGQTDFGIFNIVGGVISMLGFLNAAMAVTIQRFLNYAQGQQDMERQCVIFNIGVIFHIVIAIIVALTMVGMGMLLFNGVLNIPAERIPAAKIVYGCLICSTFFTILTVPYDACLNAHENMLYFSIVGIIEALLKLGAAYIVVYTSHDKLIIYGLLMAIIPIISMVMMRVYCYRNYMECHFQPRRYYDKSLARSMFSFVGWNLLGVSSNYIGNYGNMIVMNHFFGAVLNTVMGIANQIQSQLMVFSSGMFKALNPVIAKEAGAGREERMISISLKGCRFSTYLLAFMAVPILLETPMILDFWLKEYPEWTVLFVRLQLIRALMEQFTAALNKSLEAIGKIMLYNIITSVCYISPIFILYVLYSIGHAPYCHYIVALIVMVIIPSIIKLWLCNKYCGLSIGRYAKTEFVPLLFTVICPIAAGAIPTCLLAPSLMRLLAGTCTSEIVLASLIWLYMTQTEKQVIAMSLKKLWSGIKDIFD